MLHRYYLLFVTAWVAVLVLAHPLAVVFGFFIPASLQVHTCAHGNFGKSVKFGRINMAGHGGTFSCAGANLWSAPATSMYERINQGAVGGAVVKPLQKMQARQACTCVPPLPQHIAQTASQKSIATGPMPRPAKRKTCSRT